MTPDNATDTSTATQEAPAQKQGSSSQVDPNTMAILAQLISQQNTPAMSMSNEEVGNAQGQQLHPIQQAAQDAAIASVKKMVSDGVTQAGPHGLAVAQHIYDSSSVPMSMAPTSTSPGGANPAGTQMLQQAQPQAQLKPFGQAQTTTVQNNQAMLPPKNPLTSEGFNPQTGQMQEGGFAERALRGLVTGGLPGMLGGLLGPSMGTQMAGTKQAQVLKAGQPAEIAEPQARAGLQAAQTKTEQANLKAGKPSADVAFVRQNTTALQQEWQNKKKEIQASIYKTQSDRNIALKQNLLDSRKQVLEQMTDDLQHGPVLNRGQRLEIYRKQLDSFDGELADLNGKINQKGNSDYISTGTLPDGRRVGKKADGTTEIIPMGGGNR